MATKAWSSGRKNGVQTQSSQQLGDVDIKLLRDLKIPIIVQNYQDRISGVCNLTGDYIGTGRIAADFFLRKGYYNFAYYGITDTVWARERGEGFRLELEQRGYRAYQFLESSPMREAWNYDLESLGQWLLSLPKPVGLFACDDQFALQVSEICQIFSIRVPEEVSILGVDNDELLVQYRFPATLFRSCSMSKTGATWRDIRSIN